MVLIVVLKIDYGPMKLHEDNAVKGDIYTTPDRPYANAENEIVEEKGKVIDLVFPIVVLIIFCISSVNLWNVFRKDLRLWYLQS